MGQISEDTSDFDVLRGTCPPTARPRLPSLAPRPVLSPAPRRRYSGAMAEDRPNPEAPAARREFPWIRVAYAVTAGWMLLVLAVSDADPGHPFFDYIFSVPLAAWIGGAVVSRIARTWRKS